jgi:hypothetical protein
VPFRDVLSLPSVVLSPCGLDGSIETALVARVK